MEYLFKAIRVGLLGFLCAGCATSGLNKGQINLISFDEEKKLGKEFSTDIEKEIKLYDDGPTIDYTKSVGKKILGKADEVKFTYLFKVVDTNDVNAFAVPGGRVYVNKGLLQACDNESQLAAVVAHEIGHVVARHGTERLTAQYGVDFLAQAVLGQKPAEWKALIANVGAGLGLLAYSRTQEKEADKLGLKWLAAAGYDPNGMPEFFEKLQAASGESNDPLSKAVSKYLSTHPPTAERIATARGRIAKMQVRADAVKDTEKFREIKQRIGSGAKEPKAKSVKKTKKREKKVD